MLRFWPGVTGEITPVPKGSLGKEIVVTMLQEHSLTHLQRVRRGPEIAPPPAKFYQPCFMYEGALSGGCDLTCEKQAPQTIAQRSAGRGAGVAGLTPPSCRNAHVELPSPSGASAASRND
ncbi:hypothetical protein SKAU_G00145130 [Synaphobranchus kaupii]|uniref:Uncharacterized protein n=1 Tax=Synaphobranchus kaupii TaxID=118154 RepID=A0A9Q1FU09_SYNKA|nr:hypothetical protein SKAU_G00145130 [Synaphobranchus kaupii]